MIGLDVYQTILNIIALSNTPYFLSQIFFDPHPEKGC